MPSEWDDDTAAVMAGVDTTTTSTGGDESPLSLTTKKVKVFDKGAALALAMRHLGMLNDKLQVTANVTGGVKYTANIPKRGA
jgi:phage terminase small subunit